MVFTPGSLFGTARNSQTPAAADEGALSFAQRRRGRAEQSAATRTEWTGDKRARPKVDDDNFTLRGAKKTRAFVQADMLPRGVVEGYYPDFQLYPEPGSEYDRVINEPPPAPAAPVHDVAPADVDYRRNYMPERVHRVPGTDVYYKVKSDGSSVEVPATSAASTSSSSSSSSSARRAVPSPEHVHKSQNHDDDLRLSVSDDDERDPFGPREQVGGSSSSSSQDPPGRVADGDATPDSEQWVEFDDDGVPIVKANKRGRKKGSKNRPKKVIE